ncbi:arylesterase [Phenylobacterium sp.]|uniref:arylesterase n=1 Tax=Phenylobacterium sp. TaxID=1871053 RepID=UPI0027376B76|nr:arylesterase [Phenylobacterium sp.]MDP3659393.1 arylesterase [Phenylobacterium sp.]
MNASEPHFARRAVLIGAAAALLAACGPSGKSDPVAAAAAPSPPVASAAPVVTVLGDSITAGYGLAAADALPAQLEAALAGEGVNVQVRGAGVSGDTTAGGLARVDFSVQDDSAVCVVALGGNDMLQGVAPSQVRANLDAIVGKLQARGVGVVLAGMRAPPQYGGYAADFDKVFVQVAKTRKVALYPFLLDGVALDHRFNQDDGIHPNPQGVRLIAERLAPVVAEALRKARP